MRRSTALLATAALLASTSLAQAAISSLLVFGDSLSDVGNVSAATFGFFPGPSYFAGRFSNGPLWIDSVATGLNLPITTPSLLAGNNNAVGGSRILVPNSFGPLSSPSFSTVLGNFLTSPPALPSTPTPWSPSGSAPTTSSPAPPTAPPPPPSPPASSRECRPSALAAQASSWSSTSPRWASPQASSPPAPPA